MPELALDHREGVFSLGADGGFDLLQPIPQASNRRCLVQNFALVRLHGIVRGHRHGRVRPLAHAVVADIGEDFSLLPVQQAVAFSQSAPLIDVAAKVPADNLASLLARAAHESVQAALNRPCNLAYAQTVLKSIAPRLVVFAAAIATLVRAALVAIRRASM